MKFGHLLTLTVLACLGGISPSQAAAEQDWIRAGTFIDWPETLTASGPVLPDWREGRTIPVGYEQETSLFPPPEYAPPAELPLPSDIEYFPSRISIPEPVSAVEMPVHPQCNDLNTYGWQLLPQGLLYHSYLAGEKEPRFASQWLWGHDNGMRWDMALGGRFGIVRNGTYGWDAEGFQFDVEGAALGRIDPNIESAPFEAADYRAGFVFTWREGKWRWKLGYAHISSHVGDEYLINNPTFERINYVRDSLVAGVTYDYRPDLQFYGEIGYAMGTGGGAEPVELQFGVQYFPAAPTGFRGAPFAAANAHLRQEFDFGGSLNVEAGWAWRGAQSGNLMRFGFQHYNGPSMQWSFFDRYEKLTGIGLWYDF